MIFKEFNELQENLQIKALDFLKKYEIICVQLCSHVKKNTEKLTVVFSEKVDSNHIYGLVQFRNSLLHCLPFSGASNETELQEDFCSSFLEFWNSKAKNYYKKRLPGCINGTSSGTELILKSFQNNNFIPKQINQYFLLRLKIKNFAALKPPVFRDGIKIKVFNAKISDSEFNSLLNIQAEYEKEEVVPGFEQFNLENCRLKLKSSLKTQLILCALNENSQIISKVQTNAIAWKTIQIGGVYTPEEHRKNHYSYTLMYKFLRKMCSLKKMPVLFVKKENRAAQKLYEALKFIKITDYTIAYF